MRPRTPLLDPLLYPSADVQTLAANVSPWGDLFEGGDIIANGNDRNHHLKSEHGHRELRELGGEGLIPMLTLTLALMLMLTLTLTQTLTLTLNLILIK